MSLIMHRSNGQKKESRYMHRYVDATTRSLQDILRHTTKNSHPLGVVPYYHVIIFKYEATSIMFVCVQFVLISRNENSIFFVRTYITLPYSVVFFISS